MSESLAILAKCSRARAPITNASMRVQSGAEERQRRTNRGKQDETNSNSM